MDQPALNQLSGKIDELALKAIMAEPRDVAGLGELLMQTENLQADASCTGAMKTICRSLYGLIEFLIMNQDEDLSSAMSTLSGGVTVLQEEMRRHRLGEPSSDTAVKQFMDEMTALGIETQALAPEVEAAEAEAASPEEAGAEATPESEQPEPEETPAQRTPIVDKETCYEFISETLGSLEEAEPIVVELESDPDNKELIGTIFRCFHTAKGVSGFLNVQRMNRYTHELENLLDEVRNDRILLDHEITDFILQSFDLLREMLNQVRANLDRGELYEPDYEVDAHIRSIHALMKQAKQAVPPDEGPVKDRTRMGEILMGMGKVNEVDVESALSEQQVVPDRKIGEILQDTGKVTSGDVDEALKKQKVFDSTIRVSTDKLDHMVNMVGELVIAQTVVAENAFIRNIKDQKLLKDFSHLNRITSELQKTSMSMRMVPMRQTFQKMVRLVRDLSRKFGKQVDLVMSGEDTEIDRNMVDEIYDPMVHMVRNAMDHGIETPEERIAAGKPDKGTLWLRAFHQGGHLYIEIQDDGRGLKRDALLKKAIDRGLASPNVQYADSEVFNFVFMPGFSTASQVTDVSGRGVGMDVVKKFVEKIRGTTNIESSPGRGSKFIIKLPLTLAIIDGILVKVGAERYIIPAQSVKESFQARKEQIVTVSGKGEAVSVRGSILPLVRLHRIFEIPTERTRPEEALLVTVEYEQKEACLMVDDLVGKQEVVIKSLGHRLSNVQGFSGGTILGDGRVGLILDVKGIFDVYESL